jgi:uncharacterized protein YybS (DUF2232 family)
MMLLNVAMITVTTIVIGLIARRDTRPVRLYLYGFVIVVAGGVAMNAAHWPDLMQAVRFVGSEWIEQMKAALQTAGYGSDAAADMVEPMGPFFDASARLAPSATVMNLIAQFTIGFLWFLARGFDDGKSRVKPFVRWRMPYALTPVLASVIVIRLIGNEPIRLVADNLLLVLSIFYCVGGLALVEYGLGRLGLPGWARAVAYIMLLLLGLLGYFLTVMLGFIDSFADWRKTRQDEIQLDKA